ncbi:FAD-dependent oxidoreductase [Streptomyces boncukensis]|uniref:NAD(P)-binding protein n=1 Tax=Streptomyces boncukensis TaxID=2711219 RepID=A0A6G4WXN1_9ACTN|nr:FAD-dependent monooxygenase [Streptomyces boncukensis]NGO70049.1 NAD(P)-binding protein [Streptomyces boncukensis]
MILVIGGGIAGSAAALALHRAGFEVTVHEAHPVTGADIGAFLTLASNGIHALDQIGAAEAVSGVGFPLTGMRAVDAGGARSPSVPLGSPGRKLTRYRCVRRADLGSALQREVRRRGIPVRHGARLAAVAEGRRGVTAVFADGSSAHGDYLVGADGLGSATRAHLAPGVRPQYAGQYVFYGYTADAGLADAEGETLTMIRGSRADFGHLRSPAGETYWFARVRGPAAARDAIATHPPRAWRDRLLPLVAGDRTRAADIVAATERELRVTNALHLPRGVRWRGRRTVLIGDAAHAASPATGQGASMAMEDAVILAKALRDAQGAPEGLARYERHRRPRVERNIGMSHMRTASGPPERVVVSSARGWPRSPQRALSQLDDALRRLLDWDTPLPA